jgi:hypothetical protein
VKLYFFEKIFFNLFNWLFVGLGFLVIPLVTQSMGISKTLPEKIINIERFFDSTFMTAFFVGIAIAILFLAMFKNFLAAVRKHYPENRLLNGKQLISDDEMKKFYWIEVVGQLNNIANLLLVSFLLFGIDHSIIGQNILYKFASDSKQMLMTSICLYLLAGILNFTFLSTPSKTNSV